MVDTGVTYISNDFYPIWQNCENSHHNHLHSGHHQEIVEFLSKNVVFIMKLVCESILRITKMNCLDIHFEFDKY